ncbi:MAG: hypothetical protein A2W90_13120 [Bacteroidetes bacterium GWF2_42_66]|nr:MAG: hypothetical protein A2W92_19370 [Bacteroidetes bacterium GWA2_42_15]OFY00158.1 MAG: hypothetical protein A2W89_18110 [Bacteroidetes bacterium GWE2_42_39]OFY40300.1 MAG: hypothetical protein A2W90_13120 [Bacteroidetes bacterium GWF2_42_66]HBL73715.1 hypothetical protein [Prolixibacteraceae bacterium]HCR90725.1 hypothetical protein [Prolixibacteraceae bacterium]
MRIFIKTHSAKASYFSLTHKYVLKILKMNPFSGLSKSGFNVKLMFIKFLTGRQKPESFIKKQCC